MLKKKCNAAQKAWNLLRLALLWARKGGVFKRRIMMDLRLVSKYIKSIGHGSSTARDKIHFGERELSFDDTPMFRVKMHRPGSMRFRMPHIPCINPEVDFDFDYDFEHDRGNEDGSYSDNEVMRKSFLKGEESEDQEHYSCEVCEEMVPYEDEGIDAKADQFIAKFYEQIKLQRQISYLEYNEMLNRGAS